MPVGSEKILIMAASNTGNPPENVEVLVVGGGGNGFATAYYLAKEHNIRKIAVVEKGSNGGGNT